MVRIVYFRGRDWLHYQRIGKVSPTIPSADSLIKPTVAAIHFLSPFIAPETVFLSLFYSSHMMLLLGSCSKNVKSTSQSFTISWLAIRKHNRILRISLWDTWLTWWSFWKYAITFCSVFLIWTLFLQFQEYYFMWSAKAKWISLPNSVMSMAYS